ncbi:hypothetical protein [Alkalibacillus haloalkaliphilus]|uniref:hypothetical protein n=1 Tax=Alkalibacillus haloalkaliphilus TaxID=94136 RepID=UPI002935E3C0|nr:hypothetical protein [Alkalibacillus haloalkaliphilus]MDV2582377.1 hypothetical protein [Alkalibacillus haloalkaliphilus]
MALQKGIDYLIIRKLMSASISCSIYALFLGFFGPYSDSYSSLNDFLVNLDSYLGSIPVFLMYSLPIFLIYGTITSLISDYIARLISKLTSNKVFVVFSGILHLLFGFYFTWVGLLAAFLYFITDLVLKKKGLYDLKKLRFSLMIPVVMFISAMVLSHLFSY